MGFRIRLGNILVRAGVALLGRGGTVTDALKDAAVAEVTEQAAQAAEPVRAAAEQQLDELQRLNTLLDPLKDVFRNKE